MSKKNIAIIFGGDTPEYEVSLRSVVTIIDNIDRNKYNTILVGITKNGEWFLYSGSTEEILNNTWFKNSKNKKAFITPDTDINGITILKNGIYETIKIDVALIMSHGRNFEDGTIQGLLKLAKIHFVGSDVESSAICMDKIVHHTVLSYNGINKPKFIWFSHIDFKNNSSKIILDVENYIKKYPMFVKPANSGSSVGISRVNNKQELFDGIERAFVYDNRVLVEEGIDGQEVECAVLGNENPIISGVGEIICPKGTFYDYDEKYIKDTTKIQVSADLSDSIVKEIQSVALKAFKIMDCKGLARIDFLVERGTNKVYLNEINTLPGFTSISMYGMLMNKQLGISTTELIDKLVDLGIKN